MKKATDLFIYAVIAAMIFGALSSCNTIKQAERKEARREAANKSTTLTYLYSHREFFAGMCADNFPPVYGEVIKGDTLVFSDTVIIPGKVIDCPPGKAVKCPDQKVVTKYLTIHDTIPVSGAREIQLRGEVVTLTAHLATLEQEVKNTLRESADWKRKANNRFWILVAICTVAVATFIMKLFKLF